MIGCATLPPALSPALSPLVSRERIHCGVYCCSVLPSNYRLPMYIHVLYTRFYMIRERVCCMLRPLELTCSSDIDPARAYSAIFSHPSPMDACRYSVFCPLVSLGQTGRGKEERNVSCLVYKSHGCCGCYYGFVKVHPTLHAYIYTYMYAHICM
jgi:hypothetical protein